jgi:RNA polymerase sigma factor (sigma-70 family)
MFGDQRLLKKYKHRDRKALEQIYVKYKNDLLKLAAALAIDVPMAEDAVQDVFVRFARSVGDINVSGSLKHYLARCVVNRIRNIRRDQFRHAQAASDDIEQVADPSDQPGDWMILDEKLTALRAALARIPYDQREVICLHVHADMTFRQIAQMQESSINTVQGRYRYGINKLRELLNGRMK